MTLPRHLERAPGDHAHPPGAGAIGGDDLLGVTQASDLEEVMRVGLVRNRCLEIVDEDLCRGGRTLEEAVGVAQEKADLILPSSPLCSPSGTMSWPRSSASSASSSTSRSERSEGVSIWTWT